MNRLALRLSNDAGGFLDKLQPKQFKQVANRIFALPREPYPADSKHLAGHPGSRRIDVGEFRVCYQVDGDVVLILVAEKRNDDAAYRKLNRIPG